MGGFEVFYDSSQDDIANHYMCRRESNGFAFFGIESIDSLDVDIFS